jgi:hypothetical protein
MEPEGSLPPSQELSTGTYPEPDRSHPISLKAYFYFFRNKEVG